MRVLLIIAIILSFNHEPSTEPVRSYNVVDAYQVYNVLIPNEESYGAASGKLVIQRETMPEPVVASCFTPLTTRHFRDAIIGYMRANARRWVVQPHFKLEKPYEIIASSVIRGYFKRGSLDWDEFYRRYPDSGGYVVMSAVGFNSEKTQAIVYSGSIYARLGGSWQFHLFEKTQGRWKEVSGVVCRTVS